MIRHFHLAGAFLLTIASQAFGQALPPNDAVTVDPDVHKCHSRKRIHSRIRCAGVKGDEEPDALASAIRARQPRIDPLPHDDAGRQDDDLRPESRPARLGRRRAAFMGTARGRTARIGVEIKSAQGQGAPPAARARRQRRGRGRSGSTSRANRKSARPRVRRAHFDGRKSPMHNHPPTALREPRLDTAQADPAGRQERQSTTSARTRSCGSAKAGRTPGKRSPAVAA